MFSPSARLSPILVLSAAAMLLWPMSSRALTVDEFFDLVSKSQVADSYIARARESGRIGDHRLSNEHLITWAGDGRFRVSSTFNLAGWPKPLELEAWFDGAVAYVAARSQGIRRYTRIDFSELPAGPPFPQPKSIGSIFNPLAFCLFERKGLEDYQLSVTDGDRVLGKETYLLRAMLKEGVKPETVTFEGKEVQTQAGEILAWYGKGDSMLYRFSLRIGGEPTYTWELTDLQLNPVVADGDLAPGMPEGQELFDATGEFKSSMRMFQERAAEK